MRRTVDFYDVADVRDEILRCGGWQNFMKYVLIPLNLVVVVKKILFSKDRLLGFAEARISFRNYWKYMVSGNDESSVIAFYWSDAFITETVDRFEDTFGAVDVYKETIGSDKPVSSVLGGGLKS